MGITTLSLAIAIVVFACVGFASATEDLDEAGPVGVIVVDATESDIDLTKEGSSEHAPPPVIIINTRGIHIEIVNGVVNPAPDP